jgi:hypothetical protein
MNNEEIIILRKLIIEALSHVEDDLALAYAVEDAATLLPEVRRRLSIDELQDMLETQ